MGPFGQLDETKRLISTNLESQFRSMLDTKYGGQFWMESGPRSVYVDYADLPRIGPEQHILASSLYRNSLQCAAE